MIPRRLPPVLVLLLLLVHPVLAQDWPPIQPTAQTEALPVTVAADDPKLLYSGRFDTSNPKAPRCAWPASTVTLKFNGTDANILLEGHPNTMWQVVVDGKQTEVLTCDGPPRLLPLARNLPPGEHTVSLVKRTEALTGNGAIHGFQLNEGATLLPMPAPARRLEVIGDSISAGYGNESTNKEEPFTPQTENANIAYGALAARQLGADYTCIAWSGKKLWPDNTIVELYGRTIPTEESSTWDFSRWKPDAVVINLSTNDFGLGAPEENGWVQAYKDFIARVRKNYPDTFVFCATSPMMNDYYPPGANARTTATRYINRVVDELRQAGDEKIAVVDFPAQTGELGFGAGWHPSARQNEAMAEVLVGALHEKLGW